ncbi:DNA cytosine methyltransferase [Robertmurraya sp. FSL W8-0741]|uniref:DNA cytosine methyltransferase n=2 Tax=Robertmurraya sp. FSL W8-0741 TaxID=2954629 RepID=UPI0030FC3B6F
MRFLDLFAGIGGFRMGMEQAGHTCVGYVEVDKFARKSYEAIYDTKGEWTAHDITTVSDESIRGIGHTDVICGGFPCQAFSIAGKRKGFEDTRGTLFFEIMRFASILRPRYLFLENVKGLLNHENGNTFEIILRTMDEVGYDAEWDVLNSKNFGVPQNRERVFIIGHLRRASTRKIFPINRKNENSIRIIGHLKEGFRQTNEVLDPTGISTCIRTFQGGGLEPKVLVKGNLNPSGNGMNGQVYDSKGLAPTLTTNKGEGNKIVVPDFEVWDMYNKRKRTDGNVGTITANGNTSFTHAGTFGISDGYRIRRLTPRECWRLQGFPDWAFDKAKKVNSDSQLYKQAGNSVTVNIIYEIAKRL